MSSRRDIFRAFLKIAGTALPSAEQAVIDSLIEDYRVQWTALIEGLEAAAAEKDLSDAGAVVLMARAQLIASVADTLGIEGPSK